MSKGTSESGSGRAERAATTALKMGLTVILKTSGRHGGCKHWENEAIGDSE